jgi:hypothetical protein
MLVSKDLEIWKTYNTKGITLNNNKEINNIPSADDQTN